MQYHILVRVIGKPGFMIGHPVTVADLTRCMQALQRFEDGHVRFKINRCKCDVKDADVGTARMLAGMAHAHEN